MRHNKPFRKPRQDIRTVPTYTIPEAAKFLAINSNTLFAWYKGKEPVLVASGKIGNINLLSYRDIEEAYRVYLLREVHEMSLQLLRRSMQYARTEFKNKHPLQNARAIKKLFKDLVFDIPARGKHPRTVTSLGRNPGQLVVEQVVDLFSMRISKEDFIFPWRFAAQDHDSRPVSMNPHILSGRLVVTGTRIPVDVLAEGMQSGKEIVDIARDYELDGETVKKALIHIGKIRQKAA